DGNPVLERVGGNTVVLTRGEEAARRFWRLATRYLVGSAHDEKAKQAFVDEIAVLEPRIVEPVKAADNLPVIPHTGDLSEALERTFGIGAEVRGLQTPVRDIEAENAEILGKMKLPVR